jgi:8-oxo-dGTP pyrophosphatase MutT (NUDIX family)
VLIALFEEAGESRVILTRRADHLRTHSSQVSFPGGRIDPGETPLEASLREAEEEVGLDRSLARPLGHLPSVVTMVSGALIQPVVVALDRRPELRANPGEVARVFDVALADLLDVQVFREELWVLDGVVPGGAEGVPMWFFEVADELIWGATGRLLVDLLVTILDLEPTRGFRV